MTAQATDQSTYVSPMQIESWPIERLREYPRNPRKNDAAVDRMCEIDPRVRIQDPRAGSQRRRNSGWPPSAEGRAETRHHRDTGDPLRRVDAGSGQSFQADSEPLGDLGRLGRRAPGAGAAGNPGVGLRFIADRLRLHEIDGLLALDDEEKANAAPPLPETPVSRPGDLWLLGPHKVLCGDATSAEAVARLLGERKPRLMVTDPPYGIELDSEWRDRAGLNGCGPGRAHIPEEAHQGSHRDDDLRRHARRLVGGVRLVPSLEAAYVWHASKFTREVLDGLLRIGFVHHQQIIWNKGRTVLTRTLVLVPT